ncbi:MAG TPA: cadmium resistance transporter [Chryseolinea sp.]|nr:cadmium resistance transporter [Chryseolinea sp.]
MEFILTCAVAFMSTNIDDTFLLMLFFGNKQYKTVEIFVGQIVGILSLIIASLVLSLAGLVVGKVFIGLLGFVPIYLGVKKVIALFANADEGDSLVLPISTSKIVTVAGLTIANGGDNIGVYVPLFASFAWPQKATMIVVFMLMTIILCFVSKYLARHPLLAKTIHRYGDVVTPFVLILLGVYIMHENDVFSLLR